jgi:hypothetical protein
MNNERKLKRFEFDFNVTSPALADFINEQDRPEYLTEAMFEGRTASLVTIQDGIKFTDKLNYLEVDVFFQDGDACGFTQSGDARFPQKNIVVNPVKINMDFCPKKLRKKWNRIYLDPGVYQDDMPFEQAFATYMTGKIREQVEIMYWRSNTSTGAGNLAFFQGFIQSIDAGGAINGNTGNVAASTGITVGNVVAIFDAMWAALPAKLEGKNVVYFCGWDVFKLLVSALKTANLFHYDGVDGTAYQTGVLTLPGTGLEIYATHGLTGTNRIFLTQPENLYIGTDMRGEEEEFRIWYSQDTDLVKFRVDVALGTQVAFNNEVVQFTLVP